MALDTSFQRDIVAYLRAAFPALYVQTWEELRAERALEAAAKECERSLWVWSLTSGWTERLGPKGETLGRGRARTLQGTDDPERALTSIFDPKKPSQPLLPDGSVLVLRDFHHYLRDDLPGSLRLIRDLVPFCKGTARTVVFESAVTKIPVELEKEITLVEFALPTREELGVVLDRIIASVGEKRAGVTNRNRLLEAARGLTESETENTFALAYVKHRSLGDESVQTVQHEKANIVKKGGVLEFFEPKVTLASVGGLNELKAWIGKRSKTFSEEARAYGLPTARGLLLIGTPGCGKSLSAKAIAAALNIPLLRFDVGRCFQSLVGESESNMRRVLQIADAVAPAVLWLDEIEKGLSGLQSSGKSDGGVTARVFGTFLTWMSEKTTEVFVVATCNDIDALPAELVRKGRFDEVFFVDLPDELERRDIFEIGIKEAKRQPEKFHLEKLAQAADQFSGAEIKEAITSGMYDAFDRNKEVTTEHILDAIASTTPLAVGSKEKVETLRERAKSAKWRNASSRVSVEAQREVRRMAVR